jgi:hypothetical protein
VVVREYHQLLSVNALLPTLTNVETNKKLAAERNTNAKIS